MTSDSKPSEEIMDALYDALITGKSVLKVMGVDYYNDLVAERDALRAENEKLIKELAECRDEHDTTKDTLLEQFETFNKMATRLEECDAEIDRLRTLVKEWEKE